jgi:hypothetical protein
VLGVKCDRASNSYRIEPDGRAVFVVCIVTRQPWLAFFFQLVNVLASLALERSVGAALTFVTRVSKLGTVPRGQMVSLPVPGEPPQTAALTRAGDDIDLLPLMSSLDPSHCLAVFASVLFDRRVLLLSSNLERASLCVLALGELLRPFRWHHIFIPVLPTKWIDYTMAPMPYICAMHAASRGALEKYPLDDVVIVDLDDRSVAFFEDDLDLLPPARLSKLIHIVEKAVAAYHKTGVFDNGGVKQAFMRFFASMMIGYREFVTIDEKKEGEPLDAPPNCSINLAGFLATKKGKIRAFMDVFVLSQHFEQFIKQAEQLAVRDELFESIAADKTSRAKKLIKLPQFRSLRTGGSGSGGTLSVEKAAKDGDGAAAAAEVGAFQCTECPRSYTFEADLAIHVMKRHRGPDNADGSYQCSLCDRSYAMPEDLAFHMKKRHEAYASMPSMRTQAPIANATYSPFDERKSVRTSYPANRDTIIGASSGDTFVPPALRASVSATSISTTLAAAEALPAVPGMPAPAYSTSAASASTSTSSPSAATAAGTAATTDENGEPADDDAVLKLLGGAATGKKLVRRSGTMRKLNLTAGQQLVPTDGDGGKLAKAAVAEGDEEADVIDEAEEEEELLDKAAKRAARQSVFVQRNPKQVVLTVEVPFYGMSKKLAFNQEHKISHIVAQITDTAFFQQTRKANHKSSGKVERVQYALHFKKESAGGVKTVRMANSQQLLDFHLSDNDRVILLEVRLPQSSSGLILTPSQSTSTPSTPRAEEAPATPATPSTPSTPAAVSAADAEASTMTWGATSRPQSSPRGALLGSSRSARMTTAGVTSPVVSAPEEKKRPELPHKNATVLAQKFVTGTYSTSDLSKLQQAAVSAKAAEPSTPPGAIDSASSGHYQSFDPAMRMPPTVKVRVVVGDDPSKAFMGLTLKQRDKVRKCMEMVMAGCDALLPENYDRDGYGLYKRRLDGTFVLLPLDAPLAVASLVEGDFVYVRECTEPRPKAETNERADTNGSADSTSSGGTASVGVSGIEMLDSAVAELDDILASTTDEGAGAGSRKGSSESHDSAARKDSAESSGGGGGGGLTSEDANAKKLALPRRVSEQYNAIPSGTQFMTLGRVTTKIEQGDDVQTSATPAAPAAAATATTSPATANKPKRARIAKKVQIEVPLADVWAKVGDFFDLRWTGVEKCDALTSEAALAAGIVGIGGDAAATLASTQKAAPVGELREFRHSGSTRAIRHRCIAFRKPTPQMLQKPSGLLAGASTGADSCGYAYELAVESALVPRMPVCGYASELKLRPTSGGRPGTTVEWTATIVVREEKVIDAVSEEIEKSLEALRVSFAQTSASP